MSTSFRSGTGPENVLDELVQRLRSFSSQPVFITESETATYEDLYQHVTQARNLALQQDIRRGDFVLLVGDFNPRVIGMLLGLMQLGCVVAPLTVKSRAALTSSVEALHPAWEILYTETGDFEFVSINSGPSLVSQYTPQAAPGLIVFTSGSSGAPKGIVHCFLPLVEKFQKPRKAYRAIPFLLFDHMGGINTVLSLISSGGCIVVPPARTAEAVCRAVEKHKVSLLPTTPTFLNLLLLSGAYKSYDLSSLELVTYGTEVMSEAVLRRLVEIFPRVEFKQTYGMSEFGVLGSLSKDSQTTWVKVGGKGVESKIVDGVLWVKVASQMCGHFAFTDQEPIWCPAAEDWFCTGDLVEEQDGFIRFLGRQSDIINVSGLKVYPQEVENCLFKHPLVSDVTVCGMPNLLTGKMVEARVVLAEDVDVKQAREELLKHCWDNLERFKVPAKFVFVEHTDVSSRFKKQR